MDSEGYNSYFSHGKRVTFGSERRAQEQLNSTEALMSSGVSMAAFSSSSSPGKSSVFNKLSHGSQSADLFAKAAELARSLETMPGFETVEASINAFPSTAAAAPTNNNNTTTTSIGGVSSSVAASVPATSQSQSFGGTNDSVAFRRPASPGPLKHYSYEYVTKMQRMHQERLNEVMEASSRVLQVKEFEIGELTQKIQVIQEKMISLNDEVSRQNARSNNEREELLRSVERQKREIEEAAAFEKQRLLTELDAVKRGQEISSRERDDLIRQLERMKREQEEMMISERRQHQHELDLARRSAENELQNLRRLESEVKRLETLVARAQQEADEAAANRIHKLNEEHDRQISELQRLLNNESERLTLAREEICELSMSRGKEVMELKAKLEAAQRQNLEFREETKLKLERLVGDFAEKEKDYNELVHSLKIQIELERQDALRQIDEAVSKHRLQEEVARKNEERTFNMQQECEQMNQSLEAAQKFTSKQQQQNQELMEMVRQIQHENGILRQEILLTEADRKRLRQENTEMRSELEKMDRMIYGRRPLTTTGQPAK